MLGIANLLPDTGFWLSTPNFPLLAFSILQIIATTLPHLLE